MLQTRAGFKRVINATILMIILVSFNVNAIKLVEIHDESDVSLLSAANTLFVINGDVNITGKKVVVGDNSILQFVSGSFVGGTIIGRYSQVVAPMYPIFQDTKIEGTFVNEYFSAHWFGHMNGRNDESIINKAFQQPAVTGVSLENRTYNISSPIKMNKNYQRFYCPGKLLLSSDVVAVELNASYVDVYVKQIESTQSSVGVGVKFAGNVYNSNVEVETIYGLKRGFDFTPTYGNENGEAGSQYNKIKWQLLRCTYCIYIDIWSHLSHLKRTWVNENQFEGGRVVGDYGIYVNNVNNDRNSKYADKINGNVFNCIGFEGITKMPIKISHCWFNTFRDLRMSESLPTGKDAVWIDMADCAYLVFSIKSGVRYDAVVAKNCSNIEFQGAFVDDGANLSKGFNRLYVMNSDVLNLNGKDNILVSKSIVSQNIVKKLYFDKNHQPPETINFDDLFVVLYDGQKILSNTCEITMWDATQLTIDVSSSTYTNALNMDLRCNCNAKSSVIIKNGDKEIYKITQTGTYRVTSDGQANIVVLEI